MEYFFDTVETIVPGVGFALYGGQHLLWLGAFLLITAANVTPYKKLDAKGRGKWRKVVAVLVVLNELFKHVCLLIGGNFMAKYLPLHLCSINIFTIAFHTWKPSGFLGNFLYTICIPGAMAALLFPAWSNLPVTSIMHVHSFTSHILLVMYPAVLTVAGEIKPDWKMIPHCMVLLLAMAALALGINLLLDTNFMFLMHASPGNPLTLFERLWGSHLFGFPVIIACVLLVMHLPIVIYRKLKKKQ